MGERCLVVGLGVYGKAVARALVEHGIEVVAYDDHVTEAQVAAAATIGYELAPSLEGLTDRVDAVLPTPGLPESHELFARVEASGTPVLSEFDLAHRWDDRPMLAITGTNGKTTVTTMVTEMLQASGLAAAAVGNTEVPLIAAIADPTTDVFVVEASSFRLGHSRHFRPRVATWLNFAPDHLDVHSSLEVYEAAKARIWADQTEDDVAIANADDPIVMAHRGAARRLTFGTDGDYREVAGTLVGEGVELLETAQLARRLPHDVANALAASATARHGGATLQGVRHVLTTFAGLAHRMQFVGEAGGVRYYNDSKATAPHAVVAAAAGLEPIVLIAGGQNKGLDLAPMAEVAPRLRAVVAIGAAAADVVDAFAGTVPTQVASDMVEAVRMASGAARPGDNVLLSPGCASFDWYRSYGERGDDFMRIVREHLGAAS